MPAWANGFSAFCSHSCSHRVMFGPGYRIYFGKDGDAIIVLLVGGDKAKDIARAQGFWRDFLEAKCHGKAK